MQETGASWDEIKMMLCGLIKAGGISLNFSEMNPFVKNFPDPPPEEQLKKLSKLKNPGHLCVYPSPKTIGKASQNFAERPFSKMLVMGHGHLEFQFFDLGVLENYRSDPRYHFHESSYSGWISIRDEYYFDDDIHRREKIYLKKFALAYDEKGRRTLAVFLTDLAKLSPEHQQIWDAKRIDGNCKVIKEYVDAMLGGIWATTTSYYAALLIEQIEINKLCRMIGRKALFRETFSQPWPNGFTLFIRPTKGNFLNFAHTLDKILSDNIDKAFFDKEVPDKEETQHPNGAIELKQLGTITMLQNWLMKNIQFDDPNGLKKLIDPFRKIRNLRSAGNAHKLIEDEYNEKYQGEQDNLVLDVYFSLTSLRRLLARHPGAKTYQPPQSLELDRLRMF